jgi:murein DD-endopeptidase MepM/ murein hydrolase activator NlpD
VYAAADGIVTASNYNEEIGHFVSMDLGNNYEISYGQLKDIQIAEGAAISEGDLIGYINEPTKYYSVEGANLYLKMTCEGTPVDPLDFLNYE